MLRAGRNDLGTQCREEARGQRFRTEITRGMVRHLARQPQGATERLRIFLDAFVE